MSDMDLQAELARLIAENAELKAKGNGRGRKSSKPWTVSIYDEKGNIQTKKGEPLVKSFDKASAADQWARLRCVEGASGSYAMVEWNLGPIATRINRDEALGQLFGKKSGPVMQTRPNPERQPMGFPWKVHHTRVEFSRG